MYVHVQYMVFSRYKYDQDGGSDAPVVHVLTRSSRSEEHSQVARARALALALALTLALAQGLALALALVLTLTLAAIHSNPTSHHACSTFIHRGSACTAYRSC